VEVLLLLALEPQAQLDQVIKLKRRKRMMKLTNKQIYDYILNLNQAFNNNQQKLPIKLNFYLQKNKNLLLDLSNEIEKMRMEIIQTYGKPDLENNNTYIIPKENIETAQKELDELLKIEQEVNIYKMKFEEIPNDIDLTIEQMEAILFMID